MVEQSAGLELDEHFDLVFDSSGDVGSVSNVDELKKDLSVIVWTIVNDEVIGNVLTANIVLNVESQINARISSDERITEVNEISVNRRGRSSTVSVSISANSVYGPIRYIT